MSDSKAGLYAALAKAQGDASTVAFNARNEHHGFNYASAEAIIRDCRKPLSDNGLSLIRSKCECAVVDGVVVVKSWFTLCHADGGTHDIYSELPALEGKGRPIDKAILGVHTSILGYVLRDLLLVPRGLGEEEVSARDDKHHEPARAPAPKPVGNAKAMDAALAKGRADRANDKPEMKPMLDQLGWSIDDLKRAMLDGGDVGHPDKIADHPSKWPAWAKKVAFGVLDAALQSGEESQPVDPADGATDYGEGDTPY